MAADDVRASTRDIQEHRAAGDMVIVLGAYGFAYDSDPDATALTGEPSVTRVPAGPV